MSDRVFHASTAARDHADTAACRPSSADHDSATYDSARVSQYTTPTATISNQSVQTESNGAVSDCVHDVYCNKINAAVDSNEFEM